MMSIKVLRNILEQEVDIMTHIKQAIFVTH